METDVEKIVVDLIKSELNLPNNYGIDDKGNEIPSVIIASQNIKLFNTDQLQITVKTLTCNTFSNRRYNKEVTINDETQYIEENYINEDRTIQIDMYSRNNDARQRMPEVQMALNSSYAEELQEKYHFRIGTISNAINISGLDGGSDINRYTIRFKCLCWSKKTKVVDYYDTFRTTAQTGYANTTKFADFTITSEE